MLRYPLKTNQRSKDHVRIKRMKKNPTDIRTAVRQHYGEAAASFQPKASSGCCGSKTSVDLTASKLYPLSELDDAARGCYRALHGLR